MQPEKLREDIERALTELGHEYRVLFHQYDNKGGCCHKDIWVIRTKKIIDYQVTAAFNLREKLTYEDIKNRLKDMLAINPPGIVE